MSPTAADARRVAIGITLAAHDRDRVRLRQLVDDVPADLMPLVIESLAALADEGLVVATRDRDAAREALAGVALDLAADPQLPGWRQRAVLPAHRPPPAIPALRQSHSTPGAFRPSPAILAR